MRLPLGQVFPLCTRLRCPCSPTHNSQSHRTHHAERPVPLTAQEESLERTWRVYDDERCAHGVESMEGLRTARPVRPCAAPGRPGGE